MTVAYEQPSMRRANGRISLADIAAQPGGMEALHRRVHELRSCGVDFAANAIEREMAELDLPIERESSGYEFVQPAHRICAGLGPVDEVTHACDDPGGSRSGRVGQR